MENKRKSDEFKRITIDNKESLSKHDNQYKVSIGTQPEINSGDDDTSSISSTSTLSLFSPVSPVTFQKDDKDDNDSLSRSNSMSSCTKIREEDKQLNSNIKHVMDITKRGFQTKYCTCGSKFNSREKLNEHLELYRTVYYNYDDFVLVEEDEFNEEEFINDYCEDGDYRKRARF